ncbi:uncharacterized protein LOC103524116 [Trichonephila clavipes]|nr:uncharacterized protein LOC103524116 [Trichonephila clavipes]
MMVFNDEIDSTSALQALSNYNENNCLRVQNCRELLGKLKEKIVFQWVPSHCGLWGNERADFLAKKGTGILQNFHRDLKLHSAKLEIKRIFRESFRLTASRVARDKPWSTLCKKSHGIPSSPRAAAVSKFRLLTGHDCLCAHLFRFNLVTSPICVLCDTGQYMTAAHLDECSALNDLNCIVKSCTELKLVTSQPRSDTLNTRLPRPPAIWRNIILRKVNTAATIAAKTTGTWLVIKLIYAVMRHFMLLQAYTTEVGVQFLSKPRKRLSTPDLDAAHRTRIRLKRQCVCTTAFSFVVGCSTVDARLYAAVSKDVAITVILLTAADVISLSV